MSVELTDRDVQSLDPGVRAALEELRGAIGEGVIGFSRLSHSATWSFSTVDDRADEIFLTVKLDTTGSFPEIRCDALRGGMPIVQDENFPYEGARPSESLQEILAYIDWAQAFILPRKDR